MGVVAHLRQAMLDSDHADTLAAHYESKGGVRPAFDPALKAFHAAKTGAMPVWWEANTRDEILRALDLAEEFGTTAVIVGGREAGKVTDRLKAKGTPVVLRIDFPDEPKVPTESEYRAKPEAERPESLRVIADRATRWKERAGTAAALSKAGVKFAFASDGITKAETFPAQVRKTIAAGLSRDAALDALTRRASEIAGVDRRLGTIEVGKMGHLVAMTGPFDDEKAKVRYVLADGIKFDLDKPGQTKAAKRGEPKTPKDDDDEADEPKTAKSAEPKTKAETPEDQGKPRPAPADTPKDAKKAETKPAAKKDAPKADQPPAKPFVDIASEFDADRRPTIKTGGSVFIKDAVILTGTKGTIPKGSHHTESIGEQRDFSEH